MSPAGTADEDTVCYDCPDGTFSDTASSHRSCVEHRSCNASGLQLVLKGSTWHDSMCTSCREDESRGKISVWSACRESPARGYLWRFICSFVCWHKHTLNQQHLLKPLIGISHVEQSCMSSCRKFWCFQLSSIRFVIRSDLSLLHHRHELQLMIHDQLLDCLFRKTSRNSFTITWWRKAADPDI